MAKRTKFQATEIVNGIEIHTRVQWCNEWQEYTAQLRVAGGEWCNDYCTTDYHDALATVEVVKNSYAKRQATQAL